MLCCRLVLLVFVRVVLVVLDCFIVFTRGLIIACGCVRVLFVCVRVLLIVSYVFFAIVCFLRVRVCCLFAFRVYVVFVVMCPRCSNVF